MISLASVSLRFSSTFGNSEPFCLHTVLLSPTFLGIPITFHSESLMLLCLFVGFFSLCFILDSFYCYVFKFTFSFHSLICCCLYPVCIFRFIFISRVLFWISYIFCFSPYDHVFLSLLEYMEHICNTILTSFLFIPSSLSFLDMHLMTFFLPGYGSYFSSPLLIFDCVLAIEFYAVACLILLYFFVRVLDLVGVYRLFGTCWIVLRLAFKLC